MFPANLIEGLMPYTSVSIYYIPLVTADSIGPDAIYTFLVFYTSEDLTFTT